MTHPSKTQDLSGWGRHPVEECHLYRPEKRRSISDILSEAEHPNYIARGSGLSYGDAAINGGGGVISSLRLNRMISFDEETGILHCEAGVSLAEVIDTFLPRGFFIPVTPGTKLLTVGGAIANDVHGKNHHRDGSFASSLIDFDLLVPDGRSFHCSRDDNSDIFWATVGGIGLTGIILTARFRLQKVTSGFIKVDYVKTKDLDGVLDAIHAADNDYQYSMAWIDVLAKGANLGRAILMPGNHATPDELPKSSNDPFDIGKRFQPFLPVDFPGFALNPLTIKMFNTGLYNFGPGGQGKIVNYDSYFFPLDFIGHWNRMYGKRGFIQYQVSVPLAERDALRKILELSAKMGRASFLAVLKKFGPGNEGMLSHPIEGYTLTLDIAVRKGLTEFLQQLDRITLDHGGRLYLAKDAAMSAESFRIMYPRVDEFMEVRNRLDPNHVLSSTMARRLGLAEDRSS